MLNFKNFAAALVSCTLLVSSARAQDTKPAAPASSTTAKAIFPQLTLEEKVALCHGNFTSGGIPRLGIGPLLMLDGRQGLRPVDDDRGKKTTLLPCGLALACTWDEAAAEEFSGVLAEEMLAMKRHVLLAPMLNLVRTPLAGRNFENFGEDPLLLSRIGSAYIRGAQQKGVGACACLLVANDCEHRRHFTSSNMAERTLRELHLAGYESAARDATVWTMMTGNNLLNEVYCAQNRRLVQEVMKDEIGFDGVMITDWRAAYDTVPTALAGTDMTTGFCSYVFGEGQLLKAVKSGEVPMAVLDDKVQRILKLYERVGLLNPAGRAPGAMDSPAHRAAARSLAARSMVLLRNQDAILPLSTTATKKLLVTGPAADVVLQGGGSGSVPAAVEITPLQGLRQAFPGAEIVHLPFAAPLRPEMKKADVEWEETTGSARRKKRRAAAARDASTSGSTPLAKLEAEARSADAVIFVAAGLISSEGRDLPDMDLPGDQAEALTALARANPRVIVALASNGPVSLEGWGDKVSALIAMHYAGQATGQALADVVTGRQNPAGKLPYTFGRKLADYPVHALGEWPARLVLEKDPVDAGLTSATRRARHAFTTEYNEGVFAGYRWFDQKQIQPAYPFGFGLSYTSFEMSGLTVEPSADGFTVKCTVRNTGSRPGREVVQVYVAPPAGQKDRPARELRGFKPVDLEPGQTSQVAIALPASGMARFDEAAGKWTLDQGSYEVQVGNSSSNLPLKAPLEIPQNRTFAHR